jgi:hypothetical protein
MDLWAGFPSRENLARALRRVEANAGAPGPDGLSTAELPAVGQGQLARGPGEPRRGHVPTISVRRVTIAKPGDGERELGVPTVTDRFLQQALCQVLSPVFEPTFSDRSSLNRFLLSVFAELDEWLRRWMRQVRWKEWKRSPRGAQPPGARHPRLAGTSMGGRPEVLLAALGFPAAPASHA